MCSRRTATSRIGLEAIGRLINFNTSLLKTKTTTSTQGVQAFTAKNGRIVTMPSVHELRTS